MPHPTIAMKTPPSNRERIMRYGFTRICINVIVDSFLRPPLRYIYRIHMLLFSIFLLTPTVLLYSTIQRTPNCLRELINQGGMSQRNYGIDWTDRG